MLIVHLFRVLKRSKFIKTLNLPDAKEVKKYFNETYSTHILKIEMDPLHHTVHAEFKVNVRDCCIEGTFQIIEDDELSTLITETYGDILNEILTKAKVKEAFFYRHF